MGGLFDSDKLTNRISELNRILSDSTIWDNPEYANSINRELSYTSKKLQEYQTLESDLSLMEELLNQGLNDDYKTLKNDVLSRINELEINIYLNGEYDGLNAYIEIHPGAGGTESCDWAEMLLRMYERYSENNGYAYEEISINKGDEAGIKSALIKVNGAFAYGYLKKENGVHRLIRISPFDANKRRHTSFASVTVTPEFNNDINIEIKDEDLKIDVYHSSGAGGQSVNTSNSAVRITHIPSKIVVTCQNERSQLKNKDKALKILKDKLYQLELSKQESLMNGLRNDDANINFGSQIRSYFLEPYKLVKDHRTSYESPDPLKILDGDLKEMLEYNLKH